MRNAAVPPHPRRILRGPGSLRRLPDAIGRGGTAGVLLVTGRRSFVASGAAQDLAELRRDPTVRHWDDVAPNPTVESLAALLESCLPNPPEAIVAVGGGSVLDTAKVLAGLLDRSRTHGGTDAVRLVEEVVRGRTHLDSRSVGLTLVPTTAGSGAEVTPFATVYDGARKHSVAGAALRADVIVLDPELLGSADTAQRASSAFDAIAQAIESLWAVGATPGSQHDARRALALLLPAVRRFVASEVSGPDERAMLIGSHLAGRAIAVSRTTAAHALSYALTTDVGLPHGQAVGVTLPALVEAAGAAGPADLRVDPGRHRRAMAQIRSALGVRDAAEAARMLRRLQTDIGLRPLPHDAAVAIRTGAEDLAARANLERLGNDPLRGVPSLYASALRDGAAHAE